MTKSLVALISESNTLEKMLIESNGELTPDIENALTVRDLSLAEKVDSYAFILDRMNAMEDFYSERAEFFSKIAAQCKSAQERLKENLKYAMEQAGKDELHGEEIRFKRVPTSGTLKITDEDMIPLEYKKEISQTLIDRNAIKAAAQKGSVPGVEFDPGFSIRKYANTKAVK